ncbi:MAG: hypothetical protein JXR37_05645 [Kiritimatiellae bacterium]|nr:hypothetical protein [Kiritimatiellia bacterium]
MRRTKAGLPGHPRASLHLGPTAAGVLNSFLLAGLLLSGLSFARAEEGGVEVWVGETVTRRVSRQALDGRPAVKSQNPAVATAEWGRDENGPLIITGVAEGETVVTVEGYERVTSMNLNDAESVTRQPVSARLAVKVVKPDSYHRLVILNVGQRMSVNFPRELRMDQDTLHNSNETAVYAKANTLRKLTIRGKKEGTAVLTVKLKETKAGGEEQVVQGTIAVEVKQAEKKQKRFVKIGWDGLPIGRIVILNPAPDPGQAEKDKGEPLEGDSGEKIGRLPASPDAGCCENSRAVAVRMGVARFSGNELFESGFTLGAEFRMPFADIPVRALAAVPMSDQFYAFAGLSRTAFATADDYLFSGGTGYSFRLGAGCDVWFDGAVSCCGTDWCIGLGGQAYAAYTLLRGEESDEPGWEAVRAGLDESAWSVGLGGAFGPRVRQAHGRWGFEFTPYATAHVTELEFGLSHTSSGRVLFGADLGATFDF